MSRTISIPVSLFLLLSTPVFAQRAGEGAPGDFGDERRWLAEHPEAIQALGGMSREELGQFLKTYQDLSPEERAKMREHSGELQQLSPTERSWALQNPEAMRQLGGMSDEQRKKVMDTYRNLSPAEQQKLRENSAEFQKLSPEERNWAIEHPEAVRELGNVPDADREQMIDAYRNLPPDAQRYVRDRMSGGPGAPAR